MSSLCKEDDFIVNIKFIAGQVSEKVSVIKMPVNLDCLHRSEITFAGAKKSAEECGQVCYLMGIAIVYGKGSRCDARGCFCGCIERPNVCPQKESREFDVYRVDGELYLFENFLYAPFLTISWFGMTK